MDRPTSKFPVTVISIKSRRFLQIFPGSLLKLCGLIAAFWKLLNGVAAALGLGIIFPVDEKLPGPLHNLHKDGT